MQKFTVTIIDILKHKHTKRNIYTKTKKVKIVIQMIYYFRCALSMFSNDQFAKYQMYNDSFATIFTNFDIIPVWNACPSVWLCKKIIRNFIWRPVHNKYNWTVYNFIKTIFFYRMTIWCWYLCTIIFCIFICLVRFFKINFETADQN